MRLLLVLISRRSLHQEQTKHVKFPRSVAREKSYARSRQRGLCKLCLLTQGLLSGMHAGAQNLLGCPHNSPRSAVITTVHGSRRRGKKGARFKHENVQQGRAERMQLARLWREHLAAGCPRELAGVEIAGSDARTLDAEITACVSALLCRSLTVDGRIERRLADISIALADKQAQADEPVATYYARLNQLVSAVLTESRAGRA